MRENPWHLRVPTTEHYQWFRNLVDLHRLTEAWRLETNTENLTKTSGTNLGRKVQENLWMLDGLLESNIEKYLDDTLPEDLLGRLEHVILAVQAETIAKIINKSNPNQLYPTDVKNLSEPFAKAVEQSAWKLGRACVEARWSPLTAYNNQDLKSVLLALQDTPFSGYPNSNGFIVRRAITSEIEVELKSCPHLSYYTEVHSVADCLCGLYTHWMRGFASALNNKVKVELIQETRRCLQRWYLQVEA
jgi:hypothetical protein